MVGNLNLAVIGIVIRTKQSLLGQFQTRVQKFISVQEKTSKKASKSTQKSGRLI